MNRKLMSLLLVGVMGCAVQAFADTTGDTSNREAIMKSPMTPKQKQMMKHCMAQQKAKGSAAEQHSPPPGYTADMHKICLDQMKIKTEKAAPPPMSTTKPQY
jgi:hypothetical protein